ncbi:GGDEF domain-containing protein [Endozoicomonas numazuensis]|uniref:GGDEF domain-containing protein n=1 Tax=Endozoicomonas numazuensis TaxID=1137799 RepID=UPI00068B03D3|nr:GGDEF domain-containing protein [Endozoicomonas numazuensis]
MNNAKQLLALHKYKILVILLITNVQIVLNLAAGEIKLQQDVDWLDIFGEGGAVMLSTCWIALVLCSRPPGPVTHLLVAGLSCFFIASFQDFLDEIIRLPEGTQWASWIEAAPMPAGMILLTLGLYHWHKEQISLNQQLQKRERLFRDHRHYDPVTCLSSAVYLKQQLARELKSGPEQLQATSIILLDIDHFHHINHQHGHHEGDRLLLEISELLTLNLRRCDLICRFAGDRFAILLPQTGESLANLIADQLQQSCEHFAFKTLTGETLYHTISSGVVTALESSAETLLERANKALLKAKEEATLHQNNNRQPIQAA